MYEIELDQSTINTQYTAYNNCIIEHFSVPVYRDEIKKVLLEKENIKMKFKNNRNHRLIFEDEAHYMLWMVKYSA